MTEAVASPRLADREAVLHALYEAAELEHNLMCTYLYAAFSLRSSADDGLAPDEAAAVGRWRQALFDVAIEEMSHLAAVWNITSALGGSPRVGRTNFPIDPGLLPASVVVRLAPFNAHTLQHFIYLERPAGSDERDSEAFAIERAYVRGSEVPRLTPMGINYDTVGNFYTALSLGLRTLVERCGESKVFCGDPALQISLADFGLSGAKPVICVKTALAAFESIVMQGEGAPRDMMGSHFQRFLSVREELLAFQRKRPGFAPAFPAATNPVLRRPPRPEGRVWIEDAEASAVVDLANASYSLMLRSVRLRLLVSRTGRREGTGLASRDQHDARHRAAGRARGASSCRAVESGVSCRYVVHDAARCFAAATRACCARVLHREIAAAGRRCRGARQWRRSTSAASRRALGSVVTPGKPLRPERTGACATLQTPAPKASPPAVAATGLRRSSTVSSACRARSWS